MMKSKMMAKFRSFVAVVMTAVIVMSSFIDTTNVNASSVLRSILDHVTKNAYLSEDETQLTITMDSQWEAIPEPKILFYQANFCDYHGLTDESIYQAIYAACLVGEVDYYVDIAKTNENPSTYVYNGFSTTPGMKKDTTITSGLTYPEVGIIDVIVFDKIDNPPTTKEGIEEYINTNIKPKLPSITGKTGYHTVTADCLKRLVNRWNYNPEGTDVQFYDYLIMLYDGLIASGAPSSNTFYRYAKIQGNTIIPTNQGELNTLVDIANVLKDIPTMHLTPSLNFDSESIRLHKSHTSNTTWLNNLPEGYDFENGSDSRMLMDTLPYFDTFEKSLPQPHSNAPRITYQSYDSSRDSFIGYTLGYSWPNWGSSDTSITNNDVNKKFTSVAMLYSMSFISPEYFLSLVDNGLFTSDGTAQAPDTATFSSNLPIPYSYAPQSNAEYGREYDHIYNSVNDFVSINKIEFTDTLAPGLSLPTDSAELLSRVSFSYCEKNDPNEVPDYNSWPNDSTVWYDIDSAEISDLNLTTDGNGNVVVSASIPGGYYAKYIRMTIVVDVGREFGLDGNLTDTNVGDATVLYKSHSAEVYNLLHTQHIESPSVQCTIYSLTYDMGSLGLINSETTAEEAIKKSFSPFVYNPTDEDVFVVNDGYTLDGFILTLEDDTSELISVSGSSKVYSNGSKVALSDVNKLIMTQNITLTAVYTCDVTFDAQNGGYYATSDVTETVVHGTVDAPLLVPNLTLKPYYFLDGYTPSRPITIGDTTYGTTDIIPADVLGNFVVDSAITFTAHYTDPVTVVFNAGDYGIIGGTQTQNQILASGSNPTVPEITVEDFYILDGFIPSIAIGDYSVDDIIPASEVESLSITEDITFTASYTAPNTVTYNPGDFGEFSDADENGEIIETVAHNGNPAQNLVISIESGYSLIGYKADKDVTIDGVIVPAGTVIPTAQISKIVVSENIKLTAFYSYNVVVPSGVEVNTYPIILGIVGLIGIALIIYKRKYTDN